MSSVISTLVAQMRPPVFSREEERRHHEEKMMLRQFVLMKQQEEVPPHLTARDMRTWLQSGRHFMEECGEMIERIDARERLMAQLRWTALRRHYLSRMEQEVMEELHEEERLSQQLNRKVTREGLQMFIAVIRPEVEKDVELLLAALFSQLLKVFADVGSSRIPLSAGESRPAEALTLEKNPPLLVREVVEMILKFLLEEPGGQNKDAASAEIHKLLAESAAPDLAASGSFRSDRYLSECTAAASSMVQTVYERFHKSCTSFTAMDYDTSSWTARGRVARAVPEMEAAASRFKVQGSQGERGAAASTRAAILEHPSSKALRQLHVSEGRKDPQQEGVAEPPQETYTLFNTQISSKCIIL